MRDVLTKKSFFTIAFFLFLSSAPLFSQSPERFFDEADLTSKEVRLAILFPSIGSIRSLVELRNQGFFPSENLIVVGVYHEQETTPYTKSIEFIKDKNLEWFKFHRLSGGLEKEALFQKNSLTPEFEQIFKKSDGVIFFGGADIPPYFYNEKTSLLTQIHTPYRHFLELSFVFHLLGGFQDEDFKALLEFEPQFPLLGICLGCQSLNVSTGGTLIQDIPSVVYGKMYWEDLMVLPRQMWHRNPFAFLYPEKIRSQNLMPYHMHPIKFLNKTKFIQELLFKLEDTPYVLSAHHQMVDKLGKRMRISATSIDGRVVEAIEHEKYPNVLGVQFHPEFPMLWDTTKKFKMEPDDKEKTSLRSFLEKNPPSLNFHKKLWSWFSEKLKASHKKRRAD